MADTDTVPIDAPQTYIISAHAAVRLFKALAATAPTHNAQAYKEQIAYWEKEAKQRELRYSMKQTPITRT